MKSLRKPAVSTFFTLSAKTSSSGIEFVASLSVWQMQFMAAMWNAEIEKRVLPSTIKVLRKNLGKVKSALQDIKFEQMQKQEDKKSDKTKKRAQAAIDVAIGTPQGKRRRPQ